MDPLLINKKNEDIGKMFDDIAPRYDFLNHFLSFNIDKCWRKKLIKLLKCENPIEVLDVATGTADLAITAAVKMSGSVFTGIDISELMLEAGRRKIVKKNLRHRIELIKSLAENIPLPDNKFDAAIAAFGVRNFENLEAGLNEMLRVIKPGKKIFILEFSKPRGFFKWIYTIYFRVYLPLAGKLISGNKKAYRYLHDSATLFPEGKEFLEIMQQAGFINVLQKRLSGGIVTIYIGEKQNKM